MVDEEGKKEDKFDSAGEALGYISLEQARLVATRAAREDPGNYGRRYAGVRMVFEAVDQEEGEDYYVVTLSFRPEGDFSGRPGREQFFTEKEGAVADRQVLALPRARRLAVVSVAIGLVVVATAAAGGVLFATGTFGGDDEATPSRPAAVGAPPETAPMAKPVVIVPTRAPAAVVAESPTATGPKRAEFRNVQTGFDTLIGRALISSVQAHEGALATAKNVWTGFPKKSDGTAITIDGAASDLTDYIRLGGAAGVETTYFYCWDSSGLVTQFADAVPCTGVTPTTAPTPPPRARQIGQPGPGTRITVINRDKGGSGAYEFDPSDLNFKLGETVTFTIVGETEYHTFTVDELGIDEDVDGSLKANASSTFTHTFDRAGTFKLVCLVHELEGMVGTITVE